MLKKLWLHGSCAVLWAALLLCLAGVLPGRVLAAEAVEQTIFTEEAPEDFQDLAYGRHLNLGLRFRARRSGTLLGCRIYAAAEELGVHEVRVWDAEDGALLLGPLEWVLEGGEGWLEYRFSEVLPLEAEHEYVLSVGNSEVYQGYAYGPAQSVCNRDLEVFADSGVFDEDFSVMPARDAGGVHYFRDVIFLPDEPYIAALDHIAVTRLPERLVYFAGTSFDPAGMEVTAFFADGSRRVLAPDEYGYNPAGPLTEADQAVAIAYESQTTDVPLTVLPVTLDGIFLSKLPNKTAYFVGERFDPGGMEVTARYSDGSCRVIPDFSCVPDGPLGAEDTEIAVLYHNEYTICAIQVSYPTLDGIFFAQMPERTAYRAGEAFDPAGLEVAARYSDGSCRPILDYTYTPDGPLTPADTEIVVQFEGKSAVIPIQVAAPAPEAPKGQTAAETLLEQTENTLMLPMQTAARVPAAALRRAAEQNLGLRLTARDAELVLPPRAVRALGQYRQVAVSVARTGPREFSCTVSADGAELTEIPGGIALALPLEADAGTAAVAASEIVRGAYTANGRLCVPLPGPAVVSVQQNAKEFTDAGASEAVAYVSSRELFRGVADAAFAPEAGMTRAMLAQVLHNLAGNPEAPAGLADVPAAAWYAAAADWAASQGIAPGAGFRWNAEVTRREFAEMLRRCAGGAPPEAGHDGTALQWAVETGLYAGTADPDGTMTRLEAAELMQRYLELGLHLDHDLARCMT